jgi:hypothetical protein
MEKNFGLASDKYVGSVVFYVADGKIYTTGVSGDQGADTLAKTDDLVHAFKMGTLLLNNSGVLGRPLAISTSGTPVVATVLAAFAASEGAFTAVSLTNAAS